MGVVHYKDPSGYEWQELEYKRPDRLEELMKLYKQAGWRTWLHENLEGRWVLTMMRDGNGQR